jgi:hypothetical protein
MRTEAAAIVWEIRRDFGPNRREGNALARAYLARLYFAGAIRRRNDTR